jgi:PEGA domain
MGGRARSLGSAISTTGCYGIYRGGYSPYYSRVGGLSFNIDPYDANVYIDGEYVGMADDVSPGQMPLTLHAGRHHVDLQAEGFGPVSFDITVIAGQVIPYAGTLPYYGR